MRITTLSLLSAAWLGLSACTINPVTGERELALVSAADEVSIGETQYGPSRQMHGGDYVVDPALTDYVADVGQRLGAVSDRALPYEFAVLNHSVPNAWALPGGKIAINRGLLVELESEAELAAVLGHEIVHAAARHGARSMQRAMLLQGAVMAAAVATGGDDYSNLAVGAASVGAQLINQRHGREAELESDRYGMQYMSRAGYDPRAAVSLQQTFMRLAEGRGEQGWLAGLFASHPPSEERVEQNRATAATLASSGELGRDRYQAAIADLERSRPAYEAYDRGVAALADGRIDDAERLAAQAVEQLPGEGHFHALLGDVDAERGRFDAAARHYDDALARHDGYFYYRLRRGLARQQLRRWDEARADLEASVDLLPTADAFLGLGSIAERQGDRAAAIEHYARASQSASAAGRTAADAAARLELPENPGKYLTTRTGLDTNGRLTVEVANPTRLTVDDIVLVVRYAGANDSVQQVAQRAGPLQPDEALRLRTGLGPFESSQQYEVSIDSARVLTQ